MADAKLTALTAASALDGTELVYGSQGGASRKILVSQIKTQALAAPFALVASANNPGLALTGYSLTGSNASSLIDLAGTWNTSGNPVALKIALTNTASGATSKFISLLAGASGTTEVLSVGKAGGVTSSALCNFGSDITGGVAIVGGGYTRNDAGSTYGLAFGWNNATTLGLTSGGVLGFCSSATDSRGAPDTYISRVGAGLMGVRGTSGIGAALAFIEQTAPSAPAANGVYIYAEDNGAGKTRLMALFATGAAQQIAIEP